MSLSLELYLIVVILPFSHVKNGLLNRWQTNSPRHFLAVIYDNEQNSSSSSCLQSVSSQHNLSQYSWQSQFFYFEVFEISPQNKVVPSVLCIFHINWSDFLEMMGEEKLLENFSYQILFLENRVVWSRMLLSRYWHSQNFDRKNDEPLACSLIV